MTATAEQIETLEAYLDEALDAAERSTLEQRLSNDAELREALDELRDERAMRRTLFAAMEPSNESVARTIAQTTREVRRVDTRQKLTQRTRFWKKAGVSVAAAACFAMAALLGTQFAGAPTTGPEANTAGTPVRATAVNSGQTAGGQAVPEQEVTEQSVADRSQATRNFPVKLILRDQAGNQVSIYQFNNPDELGKFEDDFNGYVELKRRQLLVPTGPIEQF